MHDIAVKLGISAMTVSNALNGRSCVAPETAKRVLSAAAEMGFRKNVYASVNSIKKSRAARRKTIVFNAKRLVDSSNEYIHIYRDIYFALLEKFRADACELVLSDKDDRRYEADLAVADAIIEIDDVSQNGLSISNAPRICVFFERPGCWSVQPDNDAASRLAAKLIVKELGFRRIATCMWDGTNDQVQRREGFLAECRRLSPELEILNFGQAEVKSPLLLEPGPKRPEILFALCGAMAWEIFRRAQAANLSIPDELSLLGFDDFPFYKWLPLRISRLYFDPLEIASSIYDAFRGLSEGGSPRKILTPIYFKDGDSVASPVGRLVEERSSR
jgi:DNA-binding LacI/PurR family transcriptional regulator